MRAMRSSRASCQVANDAPWVHAVWPSSVTILSATAASSARSWLISRIVFGLARSASSSHTLPGDVEVVVRLVEQQHVGVRAQQHLEREPLLLAAGERRQRAGRPLRSSGWRTAIVVQVSQSTSASQPPASPHAVCARASANPDRSPGLALARDLGRVERRPRRPERRRARAARSRSRTVRCSSRQPTSWRITRSRPSTCTLPSSTGTSPVIARNSVVLPAPFAPTSATCSPAPDPERDVGEELVAPGDPARDPVDVDRSPRLAAYRGMGTIGPLLGGSDAYSLCACSSWSCPSSRRAAGFRTSRPPGAAPAAVPRSTSSPA